MEFFIVLFQLNEPKMEASLLQKGTALKNDMDINN